MRGAMACISGEPERKTGGGSQGRQGAGGGDVEVRGAMGPRLGKTGVRSRLHSSAPGPVGQCPRRGSLDGATMVLWPNSEGLHGKGDTGGEREQEFRKRASLTPEPFLLSIPPVSIPGF